MSNILHFDYDTMLLSGIQKNVLRYLTEYESIILRLSITEMSQYYIILIFFLICHQNKDI